MKLRVKHVDEWYCTVTKHNLNLDNVAVLSLGGGHGVCIDCLPRCVWVMMDTPANRWESYFEIISIPGRDTVEAVQNYVNILYLYKLRMDIRRCHSTER